MHDIFLKGLYEDFARAIQQKLSKTITSIEYLSEPSEASNISVFNSFTNNALVDIKYKVNESFIVGIQIQGNQYRHFIELKGTLVDKVNKMLEEINDKVQWFEFEGKDNNEIYPLDKEKKYNQYKSTKSIFKYKYFKIDGMQNDEVIQRVEKDIQNLVDNKHKIENI